MKQLFSVMAVVLCACGETPNPDAGVDAAVDFDAGCLAMVTPADGVRRLVVSHPYPDDGGSEDNRFEVFTVAADGVLTATGTQFRMGVAGDYTSPIIFTTDGRIGFVAQDDGTIGVFRFEGTNVVVVNAAFNGNFSAGKLLLQPSGDKLWVTDFNTQNNGGGLYSVDIGCDGALSNVQWVLPGNNASGAVFLRDRAELVVSARSLASSAVMQDVHVVDVTQPTAPVVLSSTTGFPDRDAIPPMLAVSRGARFVAAPDTGFGAGNRVAFFEKTGTVLTSRGVMNVDAPGGIAFSPFADEGVVMSTDGSDAYTRFGWNTAGTTFSVLGRVPYTYGRPQLPGAPVMISRGQLEGRMFIAELDSIRQLQFNRDGGITDVSKTPASGTGSAQILGVIGVTP